jgi:hypothetical protein
MSGSRYFPRLPVRFGFLLLAAATLGPAPGCSVEEGGLDPGPARVTEAPGARPASRPPTAPPLLLPPPSPPLPEGQPTAPLPAAPAMPPLAADAAAPAPPLPLASDAGVPGPLPPLDAALAPPSPPMPRPTPPDFCPQDSILVVCLNFDRVVQDLSRARRELSVRGVTLEPGVRGQAGRFGPGRAIQTVNGFQLTEPILTIEAAVKPSAHPPPGRRAGIVHSDDLYGLFLLGNDGDVECRTTAGGPIARRAAPLDRWTYITCAFEGERARLFINGVPAGETANRAPLQQRQDDRPRIGDTSFEGGPMSGLIDELRIWRAVARLPVED